MHCWNYLSIRCFKYVCVHVKLLQSCLTFCDHMSCSSPGSSVHGIIQARILEWFAISSSRGPSKPRDWTQVSYVSCISRQILYHWATKDAPLICIICKNASLKQVFRFRLNMLSLSDLFSFTHKKSSHGISNYSVL